MEYIYGEKRSYEEYASGAVLYSGRNVPNFPVRLIQEIYGRCLAYSNKKKEIQLYDCCCGGGYSLTVLGFLNQESIGCLNGSDLDETMTELARRNLGLLSRRGIAMRRQELSALLEQYGKDSHRQALLSLELLERQLKKEIPIHIETLDAMNCMQLGIKPDIIITDVPYGQLVDWKTQEAAEPVNALVGALRSISSEQTVIAVIMDKKQKLTADGIRRLERQNIGKRKFEIFRFV